MTFSVPDNKSMTDPRPCPGLFIRDKQNMGMRPSPREVVPRGPGMLSSCAVVCDGISWEGMLAIKECHFQDGWFG